jgi:hypothetical protein
MSVPSRIDMTASCACGRVELAAIGAPIVSNVCYCRDCQQGSRQIEALPNAGLVRDPDGVQPRKVRIGFRHSLAP